MTPDLFGIGIVPAILGLIQVAKETGMNSRFAPLASLFLGILAGIAVQCATSLTVLHIEQGIVLGIALGLAASGLYSGVSHFAAPAAPATFTPAPVVPDHPVNRMIMPGVRAVPVTSDPPIAPSEPPPTA